MNFFYRVARSASRVVGSNSVAARVVRPVAERVLLWTTGSRGLDWEINGVRCRIDPRFRAQLARNYDAHLAAILRDKVHPGQTCLDVGANIGAWVIQFANFVGPTGQVVAFEPNPDARAVLENHIRLNHLETVARVVPTAVGGASGEVSFFAAGSDGMSRIGEPNPQLAGKATPITVPMVTLDAWCRENVVLPDWLFIDIEGYEGHALEGAAGADSVPGARPRDRGGNAPQPVACKRHDPRRSGCADCRSRTSTSSPDGSNGSAR